MSFFNPRGRGRGGYRGGRGGYGGGGGSYVPKPTFDLTLCEPLFPRVKEVDDSPLTAALLKRNETLTPTTLEQTSVLNLVTKVQAALDRIMLAPEKFTAAVIEEFRAVGSFKKGTMLTKRNVADIAVLLRTLPTVEAANALGARVIEEIKAADPRETVANIPRDFGCEITGQGAVVRLLVTTIPPNLKDLDATIHLNSKLVHMHLAAIRHARWFEENASHTTVKVMVRILRDIRSRFTGMQPLNPWAVELLAHYCIMNTPSRQPLPLAAAFRRIFQLLAAGIFLPGSAGILDPCEAASVRIQASMSLEDQQSSLTSSSAVDVVDVARRPPRGGNWTSVHLPFDTNDGVCCTAQTLLRVLCHGGFKQLLGFEGRGTIATEMSVWEGVVVTPLEKAYEKEACEPPVVQEPMETSGFPFSKK